LSFIKDLLNDNIDDDVACAKMIWNRHGFDAWYGWKNNCKGGANNNYDWVSSCFK
jgi:lysozyme C